MITVENLHNLKMNDDLNYHTGVIDWGKMVDSRLMNDLIIGKSFFNQKQEDKYIFMVEERDVKSIIDYIVYTQRLRYNMQQIRRVNVAKTSFNHRLVGVFCSIPAQSDDDN